MNIICERIEHTYIYDQVTVKIVRQWGTEEGKRWTWRILRSTDHATGITIPSERYELKEIRNDSDPLAENGFQRQ